MLSLWHTHQISVFDWYYKFDGQVLQIWWSWAGSFILLLMLINNSIHLYSGLTLEGTLCFTPMATWHSCLSFFKHSSCCFFGLFVGKQGSCVGLYMSNRAEWVVAELACCAYSYVSVPLYDTLGMFDLKMYSEPTQENKIKEEKIYSLHFSYFCQLRE